jgi:hypothetical protein
MQSQNPSQPTGPIRFTSAFALSLTFFIVFLGAALIAGLNYPPKAASLPLIIGGVGAALSFLQAILELRTSRSPEFKEPVDLKKDLPIYLWIWAFVLAVTGFGFLIAAPATLFIYLVFRSKESVLLSAAIALGVLGLLYGLFQVVLSVPLFEGLLTPLISNWLIPAA